MTSKNVIHLAVFGLSAHERRVLQTIGIISRNRSRTYVVGNGDVSNVTDFALVDADDLQAMKTWREFSALHPMVPVAIVSKAPVSSMTEVRISRPIVATRLLAMLDEMQPSEERPAFVPPRAPTTETRPPVQTQAARPSVSQVGGGGMRRALVVDDSLPIRRQVEIELRRLVGPSLQVDLAEDGESAMKLLSSQTYDVAFLDVVLPGMDGYGICKAIKRNRESKHTPVIMLTGKSSPFNRVKGKLAGCDTYLTKPVNKAKFERVVDALKQRSAQRRPPVSEGVSRNNPFPFNVVPSSATAN